MLSFLGFGLDRRVTALEVELKGMSEDLRSVRSSIDAIAVKIDSNLRSLAQTTEAKNDAIQKTIDDRALRRDSEADNARKFMLTCLIGGMGTLGAFTLFIIGSVTESKIHPLDKKIITLQEELRSSQAMARKAVDDTQLSQAIMYKEITGKDWPVSKTTFPVNGQADD